ncbi:F0F1 ATP synthase subunit delta [Pseudonocardia acidicola]|uniref:ATP synthase subunit delta n=1 Tax=Pseudonocardia acidicola TaxID=2724939 RepID=A0ABX1SES0_9PSEU|nr:F0F1 ATP synthase subunit delta [Pseudonocardia acidicola]NMH99012.1 F0F1 ATP synthase subunit delta [Pseudonocardia acidicola]
MALVLQATSRESLAEVAARLDAYIDQAAPADLERMGDELFAVTRLLQETPSLRRHLADPSAPESVRTGLVQRLLNGKVSQPALDIVAAAVAARWSQTIDLVEALEELARRATLAVAEKNGTLDDVEDELFRFGRILDREPELAVLLADPTQPAEKKVELLDRILQGKVSPVTLALLRQTVRLPRGRHLDIAAEELAELAAARRDRYVAQVTAPVALTDAQEQRLAGTLSRLYGRAMSLQVDLDESLLGGLVIRVGGEVIDGSVAGKLEEARRRLPR